MKVMCPKKCKNKGFTSNRTYLKTAKFIDKKSTNLKKNTNLYKPNSQHYLNNPLQQRTKMQKQIPRYKKPKNNKK